MSDLAELNPCGCCGNAENEEPAHPPGLSSLKTRVSTYDGFFKRMVTRLGRQEIPDGDYKDDRPLAALTTRAADDFGIGIVDAWAIVGDVLTFYQERIANEGYLRTATERLSILELARAIGYELSPGVAAEAYLAFTVDESDSTPEMAAIPAGTQVQSIPQKQDELPQTFETAETFEAHVAWNVMRPRLTERQTLSATTNVLYFETTSTNLRPGDRLLIVGDERNTNWTSDRWDVRRVLTVKPQPEKNRTEVTVTAGGARPLPAQPRVYALRQRASLFGHNAPDWSGLSKQVRADYLGVDVSDLPAKDPGNWPQYTICAPEGGVRPRTVSPRMVANTALFAAESQAKALTRAALTSIPPMLASGGAALNELATAYRANVQSQTITLQGMLDPTSAGSSLAKIMDSLTSLVTGISVDLPAIDPLNAPLPAIDVANPVETLNELLTFLTTVVDYLADKLPEVSAILPTLSIAPGEINANLTSIFYELHNILSNLSPLKPVVDLLFTEMPGFAAAMGRIKQSANAAASAGAATATFYGLQAVLESALFLVDDPVEMDQLARSTVNAANAAAVLAPEAALSLDTGGVIASLESDGSAIGPEYHAALASGMLPLMLMDPAVESGVSQIASAVKKALDQFGNLAPAASPDCNVDLDSRYDAIGPDRWIYFAAGSTEELFRVTNVEETSRSEYLISAEVSRLTLGGPTLEPFKNRVRETKIYGAPEELVLAELDIANPVGGVQVELATLVEPQFTGLHVVVSGVEPQGDVVVTELKRIKRVSQLANRTRLEFVTSLSRDLERDSVTIFGNVVRATHGETVTDEALGGGNGAQPHQRFQLKKPPLTHVAAATPSGSESELTVRVDGVAWQRVSSLYDQAADAHVYVVRLDDDANATVIFGDGKMGARLPTGQENVRASYRSGIGQGGEVSTGTLTLLKTRPFGVKSVVNPLAADGAEDPETLDGARENAPLTVRTLDRIVSLRDYEDFARAFAGIGKAQAVAIWDGRRELVHLTLSDPTGNAVPQTTLKALRAAVESARDRRRDVCYGTFDPVAFDMAARILIDPAYTWDSVHANLMASLLDAFSFDKRAFGQPVSAAEINALFHETAGVEAVDLDLLHKTGETPQLHSVLGARVASYAAAAPQETVCGRILPAQLLLINATGVQLTEMTS